ncbi:MAG: hypothetical protein M3430_01160 [Acidobacteriota bacterium]|nr:hypothetical protein [Acidobacteriota bacterium]
MTDEMVILRSLEEQFAQLHRRSITLVRSTPAEKLYWQPRQASGVSPLYSCGEHILRGAAVVEQTFGGITANLWDDPFEWTLPESLSTPELVARYLDEVEATRQHGFAFFKTDADLLKEIAVPSGAMRTLFQLLAETLVRAAHHQGQAFAIFRLFSDAHLPPI